MTFPVTPILDNFNRANEGPPPSAAWDSNPAWFGAGFELEVFSNTCRQAQSGSEGGAFYKTLMPQDQEAYLKIVDTKSIGGKHSGFGLYARANSATGAITDLYEFLASTYDATLDQTTFEINRFNSIAGFVAIDSIVINVILSIGDQIGYRCVGSALEFWYCPDGGAWSVVLSATDSNLLSGGYIGVEIFDPPPPSQVAAFDNFGGGAVVSIPVAAFTSNVSSGVLPLAVQFTDTSTHTPSSWLWNFGDSGTSTSQNPAHTYAAAGAYTVTLTATNAAGSSQIIKTNYIVVTALGTGSPQREYTNLTNVKQNWMYQSTDQPKANNDQMLFDLIRSTSREIEMICNRRLFMPYVATKEYNCPRSIGDPLNVDDLLSLTTILNGDGSTLTNFKVYPLNDYPKNQIKLLGSSSTQWQLSPQGDREAAIDVSGIWGYHRDYTYAWLYKTTISNDIDASTQSIVVPADTVDAGILHKIEDEFVYVSSVIEGTNTDTLIVSRGAFGSTAAAHLAGSEIDLWFDPAIEMIARIATVAYFRLKNNPTGETLNVGGYQFSTPKDVTKYMENRLRELGLAKSVFG